MKPWMLPCPACQRKGIGGLAKFWSGAGAPCQCSLCGKLSYVHSKHRYGLQSGWPMAFKLLATTAVLGAYVWRPAPAWLWLLGGCWIVCSLFELYAAPMQEVSKAEATTQSVYGYVFLALLAIGIAAISIWHSG